MSADSNHAPPDIAAADAVLQAARPSNAPAITWGKLVKSWAQFAMEARAYGFSIYDYTNDLSRRDLIQIALDRVPPDVRAKLETTVKQADDLFRSSTQELGRDVPGAPADSGWWWRRVPRQLSPELHSDIGSLTED